MIDALLLGGLHGFGLRLGLGLARLLLLQEVGDAEVHDAFLFVLQLLVVQELSVALVIEIAKLASNHIGREFLCVAHSTRLEGGMRRAVYC